MQAETPVGTRTVRPLRPARAQAVGLLVLLCALCSPGPAAAETACTRYAAPWGSDAALGSEQEPLATVRGLLASLGPGQTGCLFDGTYVGDVKVPQGGTFGSPVVLTSRPGERATVRGRFWVPYGVDDLVVSGLDLDGRNAARLPSPTVNGDRVVFRENDVTNYHTGICFVLGSSSGWGVAEDVVLEWNRIHDCGRLPATNHEHGIYVEGARDARILDNFVYDNADRGIQLYPDAQGTLVAYNVLDANGEGVIFAGADGTASSDNQVVANVIANSTLRFNVESWGQSAGPVGAGNVVEGNCLWHGRRGNVSAQVGFVARDNVVADPLFRDRARADLALLPGSPCAGLGPRGEPGFGPGPAVAPRRLAGPRIEGRARRSGLLRLRPGFWGGSGPLRFGFRWLRCDASGGDCRPIRNAGSHAYRLRRRDVGHSLKAKVTVRNPAGTRTAVSARTKPVKA
jgi:hypothetical protein